MSLVVAGMVVAGITVLAVGALLYVRRGAPEGSYFEDGDRASGVFGVLATGFSVLLGFVVFLAFESYDLARSGAEAEARIVAQQFETAQLLPASVRGDLSGELVCYARHVARTEWPQLESGAEGKRISPWNVAIFETLRTVEPRSASEQAAYGKWLDQTSDRENARADRTHGAQGVIPVQLWIVIFLTAVVIFVFMMFFADSAERRKVQATLIGGVAIVISSMLLLLWFLDNPYHGGPGSLQPTEMERTIVLMEQAATAVGAEFEIPCDEQGIARA